MAFAFGARTGVRIIWRPFAAEDWVEVTRELAVAVADQEPQRRGPFLERPSELAGLLSDPGAAWIGGAAGEVHSPGAELDEEEHV